ncbi:MAG TPA: phosphatidate cytidylyltransferase [Trebonia sp.]|nr:phosphatidate cytidylyltransferase [Trebonia sp.]
MRTTRTTPSGASPDDAPPGTAAPAGAASASGDTPPTKPNGIATGRNLPVAAAVGIALIAGALVTLFTVKATFLIYMGLGLGIGLHELNGALRTREIRIPVIPVLLGGAAMVTSAYWAAGGAVTASFALTLIAVLGWRLFGGAGGYVRDVTGAMFATAYLALPGAAVAAMLAAADGPKRVLTFVILTICSDIGGYFAGITLGRGGAHKMAPTISPKKTWEGLGGSALTVIVAGVILVPVLLHGSWWQGAIVGVAAVAAAVLGDLAESLIKRDLGIKDMGSLLPGHGGILDRLDSLLICAPVVWLLLAAFIR